MYYKLYSFNIKGRRQAIKAITKTLKDKIFTTP